MSQQMTKPIRAIYEHGVFRPLEPVELPEGAVVTIPARPSRLTAWDKVAHLAGSIPHDDIVRMNEAMEEAFGKVNPDEWR
jgi:predicted DNA-binding antitoxin AbrB/MazE fold protein